MAAAQFHLPPSVDKDSSLPTPWSTLGDCCMDTIHPRSREVQCCCGLTFVPFVLAEHLFMGMLFG